MTSDEIFCIHIMASVSFRVKVKVLKRPCKALRGLALCLSFPSLPLLSPSCQGLPLPWLQLPTQLRLTLHDCQCFCSRSPGSFPFLPQVSAKVAPCQRGWRDEWMEVLPCGTSLIAVLWCVFIYFGLCLISPNRLVIFLNFYFSAPYTAAQ